MINKDKEVGGDHYSKMKIEPIELIEALDLDFIQGCIVKYVSRYKFKNGVEDLRKAMHYSDIARTRNRPFGINVGNDVMAVVKMYCSANDIDLAEKDIISLAVEERFDDCFVCINELIDKQGGNND